ncbi:PaRep2b protein, partial [Pyrobaculum aerophilum]
MFSLVWAGLSRLWSFGVENGLYADHIFNKLEGIRKYVE